MPLPPRVDFHLHSKASNVTDYYAANAFSIPESYSEPLRLHAMLKARGMTLITLTDHNSIDGAKAMLDAGLPDVFYSAEMTTRFPHDGCRIHVTVANMTEAQFLEIKRLSDNVYEMIAYVDAEIAAESPTGNHLTYFMTHPLMSTQNRPYGRDGSLRLEHIERMLVACNAIEVQNGARTRALNDLTGQMVRALTPAMIERLANKYDMAPKGPTPWIKAMICGSDDHAGINPGRTWTSFDGPSTPNGLVASIRRCETRAEGAHGGPVTLAHALLKLLYDGSQLRGSADGAGSNLGFGGPTQSLLQLAFGAPPSSPVDRLLFRARWWLSSWVTRLRQSGGATPTFEDILHAEMNGLLADSVFRARLVDTEGTDERIYLVIGTLANRIFKSYLGYLEQNKDGNVVGAIKSLVALISSNLFVSMPYFVAFLQQSSDCLIAKDVRKAFNLHTPRKLVLMTDTLFEVNGVSGTIRRMMREAERRGIDMTVVTCVRAEDQERVQGDPEIRALVERGRLKIFSAVSSLDFPKYDGLQVQFPPLLDVVRFLQEGGFTKMQISTPGTVGITGLFAAKLLQIETSSTYHTSFPEYVEEYTHDLSLEALAWNYMILFYHTVDEVVVPSKYIARLLHKRGLRNRKLLILDRWVDTERFHPKHRDDDYWAKHGIPNSADVVKFIYVGRLGVEKNLQLIAQAYAQVHKLHPRTHLILVGDGPHRKALEAELAGLPVTFTGFLAGAELPKAFASADVKLFPSTTDTWGNAPLEAQASGLPVVVSNVGGPCELMEDGRTGFVIGGRDVAGLASAMTLLLDPLLRAEMGREARRFTERHQVAQPFTAILDADAYRGSVGEGTHPSRAMVHLPDVDGSIDQGATA